MADGALQGGEALVDLPEGDLNGAQAVIERADLGAHVSDLGAYVPDVGAHIAYQA